jgi:leucyl/phenylalanyl-tRNA--protein transferase
MSIIIPQLNPLSLDFPDPYSALDHPNGLLAYGGDLSPERLIAAYSLGIFPWFNEGDPILWWSPAPRTVLFPNKLMISKSLKKTLKQKNYSVWINRDFPKVIRSCAEVSRHNQKNTWISEDMQEAYCRLNQLGFAHSFETWVHGNLVGGGYGILIGKIFFGESMFFSLPNASKISFVHMVQHLERMGIECIDCQMHTHHLSRFGAESISRADFLSTVKALTQKQPLSNLWMDCIHDESA